MRLPFTPWQYAPTDSQQCRSSALPQCMLAADGSRLVCTAGVFVHSIATGEGEYWDIWSSFFGNINDQVSDWHTYTSMQACAASGGCSLSTMLLWPPQNLGVCSFTWLLSGFTVLSTWPPDISLQYSSMVWCHVTVLVPYTSARLRLCR